MQLTGMMIVAGLWILTPQRLKDNMLYVQINTPFLVYHTEQVHHVQANLEEFTIRIRHGTRGQKV